MKINLAGLPAAYVYTANQSLERDGPAVVFIHGAQNDHCVWALQSRYLANHGYRVMAVDLPGHGASAGPPLTSVAQMADWIATLLDAVGIRRATLVGHSMGSLIALECAHRHQDRVEKLALVGSAVPMPVADALLQAAATDEPMAMDIICNWSHSGLTHWPAPGFSTYMMSRRLMERQPRGTLLNDLSACNDYRDGLVAAAACACPALVVSGALDQMTPARAAAELVKTLRARTGVAQAVDTPHDILAQCGHNIMAEQPDALLASLIRFLPGVPTLANA